MKRTRAHSLLAVLLMSGLMFSFLMLTMAQVDSARRTVSIYKHQVQAQAMAHSGIRYAEAMIHNHRWTQEQTFVSPQFRGGGSFSVTVSKSPRGWLIESQGRSDSQSWSLDKRIP